MKDLARWFFINFIFKIVPDDVYLKIRYRLMTSKRLNLKMPKTFNEKIQWLKLYDRKPEYTNMVDKYEVHKHIAKVIGEEYLIPCYGVFNSFDEVPFDTLPNQFVLKCTHDSASVVICKDKKALDMIKTRKHFKKKLACNYYWGRRQWAYKNIKPRIIAEKLMVDKNGNVPADYKIHCFNGEPKYIQLISDRFTDSIREAFYNENWILQEFTVTYPNTGEIDAKPKQLEKMLELTKKLSKELPYVRIDLYMVNDEQIYFGEMTFYPEAGFLHFNPPEWDRKLGGWLVLPNI